MTVPRARATRRRLIAAVAVVLVVLTGLVVHTGLRDTAITDIAGDALYAAAIYAGLVVLLPRWSPWKIGAVATGWCVAVELFQLTGLPLRWGEAWAPLTLVFGSGFDARDLLVYALTGIALTALDLLLGRRSR